ncbi:hypothetical protein [Rodentibacter caecimuris]|uniref:Uncharacterized protein n=1 Tax=Rodentibacter caecimuris TaxID=1796644 RepID=A0ABX3KXB8_9PAST|nr:hypothetical protein BKG89_07555 [Rodentibacter heylii]
MMSIHFDQILQDSWNFIRNQQKIALTFIAILFCSQVLFLSVMPNSEMIIPKNLSPAQLQQILQEAFSANSITLSLINQLFLLIIAAWGIMTIHQISQNQGASLTQSFNRILPRIMGVVWINILVILTMTIGMSQLLLATLSGSGTLPGLIILLIGLFIYIRLELAALHYLIQPISTPIALRQIWQAGLTRNRTLVLYSILTKAVPVILVLPLTSLPDSQILTMVIQLISSFLAFFIYIFTYRFYTLFMAGQQ